MFRPLSGEDVVERLDLGAELPIVRPVQPDAEARPPVVIPGEFVVKAKALRTLPRQAHRHLGQQFWEMFFQSRAADLFIVEAAELQPFHEAAPRKRRSAS